MPSLSHIVRIGSVAVLSASTFVYYNHYNHYNVDCKTLKYYENRNDSPQFTKEIWDKNWDLRHKEISDELIKESEQNSDVEKEKEITATRHVILIRHGQYDTSGESDELRTLTDIGREQATLTGERLKNLNLEFNQIIISTMTRAQETGQLIGESLPHIDRNYCSLLREGKPYPYEPSSKSSRSNDWDYQLYRDNPRIESAFRKYIHRADAAQENDSLDLIVCHANVIRYFVCRALQFPPEGWLRMGLAHGSITWIAIQPNGNVFVYVVGSWGHLPSNLVTYS